MIEPRVFAIVRFHSDKINLEYACNKYDDIELNEKEAYEIVEEHEKNKRAIAWVEYKNA